jgi:hypothetical protein
MVLPPPLLSTLLFLFFFLNSILTFTRADEVLSKILNLLGDVKSIVQVCPIYCNKLSIHYHIHFTFQHPAHIESLPPIERLNANNSLQQDRDDLVTQADSRSDQCAEQIQQLLDLLASVRILKILMDGFFMVYLAIFCVSWT